ncbi:SDR family NAD(P)-dependent oxidoreductase [Archangium violaceum]|uniref:type I polyketide synthase n=1 Tax=Archangium violaceum TaxID=83451 RepID=UPI00194EDD8C|nr:type I polyketide synthase [Archangium violaceum]QRN93952.1 SDR family NAD(P)-dependent oxidoreductase [Archangium violaceum]
MSEDVKDELKQRLARAVLAMQKMQARIDALELTRTEPIAIVGMGCRFPGGADTPEAYWKLLAEGREAIRREPASRREGADGSGARWGGYLDDVSGFDAGFFGISPREAASMDPQQRLLLEVVWEALEHAGVDPERLAGSPTGVFVGLTGNDYERLLPSGPGQVDAYFVTGNGHCFPPGRLSYLLGLQGPSLAVDTACSSSLVAVHLACQSLRSGECNLALAGGVNLILDSFITEGLVRMQALSPNGRCSAFDARANGFVRGEGCGVVVLKRLSDAKAQGDDILAIIRGTAINQDGRSTGFTAPNVLAQQALLRQALASARVEPSSIGYVEAHGTGTPLGDPIEVEALIDVLGKPREDGSRCALASVKTNLGHLEAAAGVAGLIKAVLALQHEAIPRHLNFSRLNPRIQLEGTPFFVPTEQQPWTRGEAPRRAGVSSFGMSGTNAHVILEEAPSKAAAERTPAARSAHMLTLSARSEEALVELARRQAEHLGAHPELDAADVCFTANTTRARLPFRLAVAGGSTEALTTGLKAFASGSKPEQVAQGKAGNTAPKVAFLFTGQGSQFTGMGRRLYETSEVYREALNRCAAKLKPRMDLLSVLFPKEGAPSPIDQTLYSQPALFALEYALAEVWRSWGVVPDAVMGHSVGEFAAACVAGILSMEDALELIAERGRLMQALPAGGVMATVFATEEQVAPLLAPYKDRVSIAAYNAPGQLSLSGQGEALAHVTSALEAQGIAVRRLNVSHAFHSPLLEPMLGALEMKAAGMTLSPAKLPLISNVTGRPVGPGELGAPGYWRRHAREAVRFQQGLESLRGLGIDTFVEVGPHTTLLGLGRACLGEGPAFLPSLRKGKDDLEQMLGALGHLFVRGYPLDWRKVDPEPARRKVELPHYPWQRQRYWVPAVASEPARPAPVVEAPASKPEQGVRGELYGVEWAASERKGSAAGPSGGTWLLLCDQGGVGERLAEALGPGCVKVYAGSAPGPESLAVSPLDAVALEGLWRQRFSATFPCAGVVYLWGLDVAGVEGVGLREACAGVASVLRVLESAPEPGGRLWIVTRGAQPVGKGSEKVEPAQAPLWGLGRVAALEHPERWGGLIDLGLEHDAERLWEELSAVKGEDQVALRGMERYVARLVRREAQESRPMRVEPAGTYLVTGGQGALGLQVARWLVGRGARHLVLTARSAFPERARWDELVSQGGELAARIASVRELESAGATVLLAQADVARRDEMVALLERMRSSMPALRGVIHAAGVSTNARLQELDVEKLDRVLAPKVEGAWNLHELTRGDALDFFVLFSSISSVWGSTGSGHYAAGNAFLDALVAHRREQGLVASVINWGPWSGAGMASPETRRWLEDVGVDALAPEAGVEWMERLLAAGVPQGVVAAVRWERFKPVFEARSGRRFLERISDEAPKPKAEAGTEAPASAPWREAATPAARREALQAMVRERVARVLGLDAEQPLPPERGFAELGMDSIMAVELKGRLQDTLGLKLPATLAFNFPNLQSLTEHLSSLVEAGLPRTPTAEPRRRRQSDEPIAIVGLACRFPGGADTPEAFWELLREGTDATVEVPGDRWDADAWYDADPEVPGKMYVRRGGFLRDVASFEPRFFGISPREAESMDPQQRLLLEVAWEALENAGQDPHALRNSRTGVFVGISASEYSRLMLGGDPTELDAYLSSGTALNVAAGRLSYTLGLQGPSMAVDTACSSALVSVHLACQSLRSGESSMALAAGVNLVFSPEVTLSACKARMLATDGRCKTFDASANGFARGEGCGVLVLERLSEARAKGHTVLALIRGSAVNQDGPSSGLTVPNGLAQQAVIQQALRAAGVSPPEVSYLEAHGTGTSLGDPIEAEAMWSVFKQGRKGGESLWMGSVKTNIGHLESAAGIAGVAKVVLAMRNRQLPAHLHLKEPNPHIDWKGMGVAVPVELTAWEPTQGRRIAGVSSFGFSGTNAHVVLEEAPPMPEQKQEVERPEHVLVLSARSAEALRALSGNYARVLEGGESLGDVCFTAAVGRAALEHRLAVVGGSGALLRERLEAVAAGREVAGVIRGSPVGAAPKVAFVFGGELWTGLGRELDETQPVFREALGKCEEALKEVLEKPLRQVLYGPGLALLKERAYARAAVFALEWSLAQLWRAWGVKPEEVVGLGVGEHVAAVERGAVSLEEGLRLAVGGRGAVGGQWDVLAKELRSRGMEVALVVGSHPEGRGMAGGLASLRPGRGEWSQLLETLSTLYVRGVEVDWAAYDAPYARRRVRLPTYPFQRQRYWWRGAASRTEASAPRSEENVRPHLGRRLRSPALDSLVYEATYSASRPAHLEDHRLFGTVVVAGSSHVSLALSAVEDAHGSPACTLENLTFSQALVLADDEERTLQVILAPREKGSAFEVRSLGQSEGSASWLLHATGELRLGQGAEPAPWASRAELHARCQERRSGADFYRVMLERGYTLGPGYQWIHLLGRQGNEILGEMKLPPLKDRLEDYPLHPGLIDSCIQVLAGWALDRSRGANTLFIPFSISRFSMYRRPRGTVWVHARVEEGARASSDEFLGGDLRILDEQGVVAEISGFRGRLTSQENLRTAMAPKQEAARYEITWRPEPTPRPAPAPRWDGGPWVLLTDGQGVGERLGRMLEERGAPVIRVRPGAAFRALGPGMFELDARRPQDFSRLLNDALGQDGCAGVVYLWGLDQPALEDASAEAMQRAALAASGGALHLVQALAGRSGVPAPLWLVTRGAQAVNETRPALALAQASLWGLGRVLDVERTELRCTRVDLDPEDLEGGLRLLLAELGRGGDAPEREVAFRGGARLHPVLRRDASARTQALTLRPDATYLLTGGLGGLGLEVAKWMVEQGARHLVLVGRRAPSAQASEAVRGLERAGAHVTVASVDVSREAEVARLLQRLDAESPPLRGILHAAGVLDDGALAQLDLERFERVMSPKVAGAWNLHRLTEGRPLDFFVLFSSASATLGSAGQGNYAAANAFLDALAHERRARGRVCQSLDWGPWAEVGMVGAADGHVARVLEHRGIRPLSTQRALELFSEALASGGPQVALLSIQWPVYLEGLGAVGRSSFYETLAPPARSAAPRTSAEPASSRYPLMERLRAAPPHERERLLARSLQEDVARILHLSTQEVDWRQGFAELGMDSLMAIELRNVLQKGLGASIPATVALDHPTIDFLVKHLLGEVLKLDMGEAPKPIPVPVREPEDALVKDLDALSDADLARLVAEDLAKDS